MLYNDFCDAFDKLNDEELNDKNFVAFFEELTAKMDPPKRKIKIIDPLNRNDEVRNDILLFLSECKTIENPA